jgi:hypothetical protein
MQVLLIITTLTLASLATANMGDLNSIFSVHPVNKAAQQQRQNYADVNRAACDRKSEHGESYERHTVINNLDKALEIGLNTSFHDRFECMQSLFDDKLAEMQHFYKLKLKESKNKNSTTDGQSQQPKPSKKNKNKSHKKNKQQQHQSDSSAVVGQTGFVFYSINANGSVTDFKHESFKFVQPLMVAGGANQTHEGDVLLLESEIDAFNSDMFVLKAIMASIKKNIRARVNLLKAIRSNERELEGEMRRAKNGEIRVGKEPRAVTELPRRLPRDVAAKVDQVLNETKDVVDTTGEKKVTSKKIKKSKVSKKDSASIKRSPTDKKPKKSKKSSKKTNESN